MEGFLGSGGAALGRRGNPRQGQKGKVQATKTERTDRHQSFCVVCWPGLAWPGSREELAAKDSVDGAQRGAQVRGREAGARVKGSAQDLPWPPSSPRLPWAVLARTRGLLNEGWVALQDEQEG